MLDTSRKVQYIPKGILSVSRKLKVVRPQTAKQIIGPLQSAKNSIPASRTNKMLPANRARVIP
jgi:hypothetical protein